MPIAEIGAVCRKHNILFHTDAVQAVGHIPVSVKQDNIDMLSLSAHKFHGPKGIGVLYAKKGVRLHTLLLGGAQERGKRAGTENIPSILGMGCCPAEACDHMKENMWHCKAMRDSFDCWLVSNSPFCFKWGFGTSFAQQCTLLF